MLEMLKYFMEAIKVIPEIIKVKRGLMRRWVDFDVRRESDYRETYWTVDPVKIYTNSSTVNDYNLKLIDTLLLLTASRTKIKTHKKPVRTIKRLSTHRNKPSQTPPRRNLVAPNSKICQLSCGDLRTVYRWWR
jgi:hypothetical protein